MLIDFRENPGQVPGQDVLAGRFGRLGALHEAPAILLEELPVPVGENGLEDGLGLLRPLGNLRLEPGDFFLRLVALDLSFEGVFLDQCLDRLGPVLFGFRGNEDRFEFFDRGLGPSLGDGVLDAFPISFPGTEFFHDGLDGLGGLAAAGVCARILFSPFRIVFLPAGNEKQGGDHRDKKKEEPGGLNSHVTCLLMGTGNRVDDFEGISMNLKRGNLFCHRRFHNHLHRKRHYISESNWCLALGNPVKNYNRFTRIHLPFPRFSKMIAKFRA